MTTSENSQAIGYAWCAGFFEGEGCTYLAKLKNDRTRVKVSLSQRHPEVLERFLAFIEMPGKVNGPYSAGTKDQKNPGPRYLLRWSGARAEEVLRRMWPYMGEVKKEQARRHGVEFDGDI